MALYRHAGNVVFFVHIPKTGGTSIEAALRGAGAAEALRFRSKKKFSRSTMQHMHAAIWTEAVSHRFYDWAFTVVRNPYNRFASEYRMKVLDAGFEDGIDAWTRITFDRYHQYSYTRDNHVRPQFRFVTGAVEVFHFEDGLGAPVAAAAEYLDVPVPELPHKKRGSSNRIPVAASTIEMIADFYKQDFTRFGYDVNDHESAFELT